MDEELSKQKVTATEKRSGIKFKDFQREAMRTVTGQSQDTFVCVPTGRDKTLCYSYLPEMFEKNSTVIVISPLMALMKDQVKRLKTCGTNAANAGDVDCHDGIRNRKFQIVFASPKAKVSGTV